MLGNVKIKVVIRYNLTPLRTHKSLLQSGEKRHCHYVYMHELVQSPVMPLESVVWRFMILHTNYAFKFRMA